MVLRWVVLAVRLQEEESEYETDSEEEQLDQQRLKPLFVKREEREVRA